MAWWERYAGVLREELDLLAAAGMQPRIIRQEGAEGLLTLEIHLEILGGRRTGYILYPDLYPYFRPVLFVSDLGESLRHYNPHTGEVCLLRSGSRYWQPQRRAASLIEEMLPKWEEAAVREYAEERLEIEDSQAEPASAYFPNHPSGSLIMIDSSWDFPPEVESGNIEIAIPNGSKDISPDKKFIGWILKIQDQRGISIQNVNVAKSIETFIVENEFKTVTCSWSRLDEQPKTKLDVFLQNKYPEVWKRISRLQNGLYGLCFPEESPKGGMRDGWIFIGSQMSRSGKSKKRRRNQPPSQQKLLPTRWLVKTEPAGEADFFERILELSPLRNKIIAVIGLGCVGAPSALAFARAGVKELRLLDSDIVSPGTICRWPFGFPSIGEGKVKTISEFIKHNYPFTSIGADHYPEGNEDFRLRIGESQDGINQMQVLETMIDGVDLIYDATAEEGINHLLSDLARTVGKPYVTVSSRTGGWGGNVVRIRPDSEGCYVCYQHALDDGSIESPPFDPEGSNMQPAGCSEITFKAAGFDVEEVSLAGVRMAVSELCEVSGSFYPSISDDIGILFLRKNGSLQFPEWKSYKLKRHEQCDNCDPPK